MTILISSHILSEVEKMVSHVGIIFKGKMLFQGTLQELQLFQQNKAKLLINTSDNNSAMQILRDYDPQVSEDVLTVPFTDMKQVAEVGRTIINNNLDLYLLQPKKQELEQLFIELTSN
jgi:ABC-2 type transport system ATP-binding protein